MNREGAKRSRAYHSYFEGYTETYNEKGKIERIYTEDYIRFSGSVWKRKLLIAALFLIGELAFLAGAWMDAPVNHFALASACEAITLIMSALAGASVWEAVMSPSGMKLREYRNAAEKLPNRCLYMAIGVFALFLMGVVLPVITRRQTENAIWCPALFLISGAAMLTLSTVQKRAGYETVKNPLKETIAGSKIY